MSSCSSQEFFDCETDIKVIIELPVKKEDDFWSEKPTYEVDFDEDFFAFHKEPIQKEEIIEKKHELKISVKKKNFVHFSPKQVKIPVE